MKYNKEMLLDQLVALARLLKRKPTKFDLKDYNLPNANIFRYHGISLGGDWLKELLYSESPKYCKECSEYIPFDKSENVFCDSSCFAKYSNKISPRKEQTLPILKCLMCSEEFKSRHDSKYCSRQCMFKFQEIKRFRDWYEDGVNFKNKSIRDFLTIVFGYRCHICRISEWNGKPITLEVEHIDGNSEDSSKENVCLLCPNCHSQTETYKGKNIGNGRHIRRLRYKEGKSY